VPLCTAIAHELALGDLSPKLKFAVQLALLECYRLGVEDGAGARPVPGTVARSSSRPTRRPTMRRHKH
jgi:hypothetical protein